MRREQPLKRYSFAIPLETGEFEIGFADGRQLLAILAARREMNAAAPSMMNVYTGERVTEAQVRADVAWKLA